MKWYDKEKTKMIDLESVNGYVYLNAKDYVNDNPDSENVEEYRKSGDKIELIIGGSVFVFRGEQARELYELLLTKDNKQIL
jgi:hypothetical protein